MVYRKDKYAIRLEMVKAAKTHGIKPTARRFGCSINTVRLWLRRFEHEGRAGLKDASRAPKSCPHKLSARQEAKVVQARQQVPCMGARRLKEAFGLEGSPTAIARVLRQKGLIEKRKKKYQKKNDLRAFKAHYKPFERIQADTKHLYDIPTYYSQMKTFQLPRYQYTHHDVKSGALFIDYGDELSSTYAELALQRIAKYLALYRISLHDCCLTTDNGCEYGGTDKHERLHGFHARIQQTGLQHRYNPPATPNANANVESTHHFIERELFDLEAFRSREDFFHKVATFQLYWNFARKNYSKGSKTPAQILEEQGINPLVLLLPPLDLDAHFRLTLGDQHVPVDTE